MCTIWFIEIQMQANIRLLNVQWFPYTDSSIYVCSVYFMCIYFGYPKTSVKWLSSIIYFFNLI